MQREHMVLCVDDDQSILKSLKRLLRRERYRFLTASSGEEALKLIEEHGVQVVISDQRMSRMNGIEFLSAVREKYPDTIRIILTGYTDVDTIMESVNKGHIYKFLLKPWNDQELILSIRKALEQYDLIQSNRRLQERILYQNEQLKRMNETLERRVQERTRELEIRNQLLELSRAILEEIPIPVIGVSAEGMIVLLNRHARSLRLHGGNIEIGMDFGHYFSEEAETRRAASLSEQLRHRIIDYPLEDGLYDIDFIPLCGDFRGKGTIVTLKRRVG